MTKSSVKQLFRKSIILISIILIVGCSTLKKEEIHEREIPKIINPYIEEINLETLLVKSSFISETPINSVSINNTKFSKVAEKYSYKDFPKKNDILSIIAIESGYKPKAYLKGCYGLMQINKNSHRKIIGNNNIYDPETNIKVGAFLLNQYYNLLNRNKRAAILAYNSGIGNYIKGRYRNKYYTLYTQQLSLLEK